MLVLFFFTSLTPHPQFPDCPDQSKVAVSCLDLSYTVTVTKNKEKDERNDRTEAVVLHELTETDTKEEGMCVRVCIRVCTCVRTYARAYVCVCAYVYVCACVRMCVRICIRVC